MIENLDKKKAKGKGDLAIDDDDDEEDESEDDSEDDEDESVSNPLEERKGNDLVSHKSLISNPVANDEDKIYEVKMSDSDSSSSADGQSLLSRLRAQ